MGHAVNITKSITKGITNGIAEGIAEGYSPDASGQTVLSPVTGEALGEHTDPDRESLEALLAAIAEVDLAAQTDLTQRCGALRALADALETDANALAAMITLENGCPSAQAANLQVHSAVGLLRAMADQGEQLTLEEERHAARGGRVKILRHPLGPALGIVPWNVPLFLACAKLASSLIAGCPMLLKPSPENMRSMQRFAGHLNNLDLPSGAISLITGGRELGAALVAHPLFRKVSCTGSTAAGRAVARACADRLARCTLALGGKSAAILLDALDFEAVQEQLFQAMLQNNGQVCGAQSRLLIPDYRYGEYRDRLVDLFESLQTGDPRDPATHIGPVVSTTAKQRIEAMVRRADDAGLKRLTFAPTGEYDTDALVAPRLFEAPDSSSELWREEVFGPVVVLQRYANVEHAITLANDSNYGLSGSVWSADTERAETVARQLRTGTIGINSKKILDFAAPFGGWRDSGMGREFGPEGVEEYLEYSSILTH